MVCHATIQYETQQQQHVTAASFGVVFGLINVQLMFIPKKNMHAHATATIYRNVTFYVRDKFIQIQQNRPLDKFMQFLFMCS